jgi:hypothetical protein
MSYKNFDDGDLPGFVLSEANSAIYAKMLTDALALPWGNNANVVEIVSFPRGEIRPMLSETYILVREFQIVTPIETANNHLVTMLPADAENFAKRGDIIKKASAQVGLSVYWVNVRIENRLIDQTAMRCLLADVWVWLPALAQGDNNA